MSRRRAGRIDWVGAAADHPALPATSVDLRPLVVLPGMVDLHAHLPQLPNAGLGAGMDLLAWLDRYIFPIERSWDDPDDAGRPRSPAFRAFAAAGTTTVLAYGAVYAASLDAAFRAAEALGIRAILGKVMMDRVTYDATIDPATILDRSVRESEELMPAMARRRRRAPRVCRHSPLRGLVHRGDAARVGAPRRAAGAWWQTHVAEDKGEIAEVARLFPEARDYVDVYDRAGGLGARTVLAHAVHLSDRELARLVETGHPGRALSGLEPVPRAGIMPLARYLEAGLRWASARTSRAGRTRRCSRSCAWAPIPGGAPDRGRRATSRTRPVRLAPPRDARRRPRPRARRSDRSIETGKEADLIAVDPRLTQPVREMAYDAAVDRRRS